MSNVIKRDEVGKTPKKSAGRSGDQTGVRVPLGLRVTPETKQRLDSASRESGRSQSQEAEFRLERSFAEQRNMIEAMELTFGRDLAGVLLMIGHAMQEAGRAVAFAETGTLEGSQNWLDNAPAFAQAKAAAERVLEAITPAGTSKTRLSQIDGLPSVPLAAALQNIGAGFANSILEDATTGKPRTGSQAGQDRAQLLHRLAGRLLSRPTKQRKARS